MPRWLKGVLARIHGLADARKVRFTHKALRELGTLGPPAATQNPPPVATPNSST
jgi:hypothetical protein